MKKLQRLELLKDFVQEAVDRGATSVEAIHQYIADLPFEALEVTGLLKRDDSTLRSRHQQTIGMVYGAIRRINREIGQLISDQFENVEEAKEVETLIARPPSAEVRATQRPVAKAAPKPAPMPVKPAPKKPAAKKAVVKQVAAKTAPVKKVAIKKATAKKLPAKKAAKRA